jgi:hypothetical protein
MCPPPKAIDVEKQACVVQDVGVGDDTKTSPPPSSLTSPPVVGRLHLQNDNPTAAVEDSPEDDFVPPDGGWRAWSQVLAAHLVNAMSWGYASSFGVYQLYYVDSLGLPAAQVSWIGSCQVFFIGLLLD